MIAPLSQLTRLGFSLVPDFCTRCRRGGRRCRTHRGRCVHISHCCAAFSSLMDLGGALLNDPVVRTGLGQSWLVQHLNSNVVICYGPNLVAISLARFRLPETLTSCVRKRQLPEHDTNVQTGQEARSLFGRTNHGEETICNACCSASPRYSAVLGSPARPTCKPPCI
jgi:hypothetical protein